MSSHIPINGPLEQELVGKILADHQPVNELSNTIDLQSTLIRAEALFRRFQRTVEAVDRKHTFPAPSVRHRKSASPQASGSDSATTGADAGTSVGKAVAQAIGAEKQKVISPELRGLLSRKIITLDKQEVAQHGGGV